jgi:hypothetical protein
MPSIMNGGREKRDKNGKKKIVSVFVGDKKDEREIVKSTKSFSFQKRMRETEKAGSGYCKNRNDYLCANFY